jgi:hypothetical protein
MSNNNKVIEFKPKSQQMETSESKEQLYFDEMLSNYTMANNITVEQIMGNEDLVKRIREMKEKNYDLVFMTEEQAVGMAAVLIELPEYENVSHFDIRFCISRLSVFYKLVPVEKTQEQFVFIDNEMMHTVNKEMMKRIAKEMVQNEKTNSGEGGPLN